MTTTTPATPEPDDIEREPATATTTPVIAETPATPAPAPSTSAAAPPTAPQPRRRLSGGPLAAIIVGGVLAVVMIFGGGVALGIALPIGDDDGTHQAGVPGGGFGDGDRPGRPGDGDRTNPNGPSAPNQNDTDTQDESEQG